MMTGLYPHEHRVGRAPDSPSEFGSLPKERMTMAEVFTHRRDIEQWLWLTTLLAPDFGLAQDLSI